MSHTKSDTGHLAATIEESHKTIEKLRAEVVRMSALLEVQSIRLRRYEDREATRRALLSGQPGRTARDSQSDEPNGGALGEAAARRGAGSGNTSFKRRGAVSQDAGRIESA